MKSEAGVTDALGALDAAPCGFLSFSDAGKVVQSNATLRGMLGYEQRELEGRDVASLLTVAARIFYQTHLFPLLRLKGRADEIYLSLQDKRGEPLSVLVNAVRHERAGVMLNDCILVRMKQRSDYEDALLAATRQSEQVAAELSQSQHFLRRVAEVTPGAIEVFDLQHRRTVFVGRSVGSILGYSSEGISALGADVVSTLMHPGDVQRFSELMKRVRLLGDNDTADIEYRLRHQSGEWRWLLCRVAAFSRDEAGVREIISTSIDVTGRVAAEEGLRASEQQFRVLTVAMPQLVWSCSSEGACIFQAPQWQAVTGQTVAASMGYGWVEMLHPDDRARAATEWQKSVAQGDAYRTEYRLRTSQGNYRWFLAAAEALRDTQGKVLRWIGTSTDIDDAKTLEMQLRQSEARQRLGARVGKLAIAELNYATGLMHLEPESATMFGFAPDTTEVPRQQVHARFHAQDRQRIMALIEQSLDPSGDGAFESEYRIHHPDGTIRWHAVRKQVFFEHDGQGLRPVRALLAMRDITQSKQAEAALRQNAELFVRLVEQAPTGMYVVDADLRLQQINARAAPVFGTVSPLIGRDLAEVLEILWGAKVGGECTAIFRQTLLTGERYISPPFIEQRQDIGQEQAYDWETQRVTLADGRHGVACYFQDITERKRIERVQRESEERARLATEATGVGIWEWNLVTGRVWFDAQMFRIYGMAPTADGFVSYSDWSTTVLPAELPEHERALQEARHRRGQGSRRFRILRSDDGQCRNIQSVETVRINAAAEVAWVIGTNLDVTERVRMEEALKDADRRKDEFLGILAHELRNPLAPISNALELLKRAGSNTGMMERARAIMERQVGHIVRLIDDLLDISRITRNTLELKREPLELADVMQRALETCRPNFERLQQVLEVSMPQEPILLHADPVRLLQVFGNLLTNASKYTPPGGSVWLHAERQGDEAVVSVSDSGMGIPAHMLTRVFDLFTQVEGSLEQSQGGLGIGLSLVKRLVEQHEGTVSAHSEGSGRGSQFLVRLPVVSQMRPAAQASTAPRLSGASSRRVLVVDDNRDGADSLVEFLGLMGCQTLKAHDGAAAVEAVAAFLPDVILLDIGLPILSGYDACRRIREQPEGQDIMIIAMTGWGQEDDRRKSTEAGFDSHLVKPVDHALLMKLLSKTPA